MMIMDKGSKVKRLYTIVGFEDQSTINAWDSGKFLQ
jgi:hypothetical protein